MTDENFIVVQGWMINKLNLKGNDLLCYALVYGFSQDGETEFTGSAQYVADWLNIDKRRALDVLKRLSEGGYLIKSEKYVATNVKVCGYKIAKNVIAGDKMSSPSDETSHNNIDNNINNTSTNVEVPKPKRYITSSKSLLSVEEESRPKKKRSEFTIMEDYSDGDTELYNLLVQWYQQAIQKLNLKRMRYSQLEATLKKLDVAKDKKYWVKVAIDKQWASFFEPSDNSNSVARVLKNQNFDVHAYDSVTGRGISSGREF